MWIISVSLLRYCIAVLQSTKKWREWLVSVHLTHLTHLLQEQISRISPNWKNFCILTVLIQNSAFKCMTASRPKPHSTSWLVRKHWSIMFYDGFEMSFTAWWEGYLCSRRPWAKGLWQYYPQLTTWPRVPHKGRINGIAIKITAKCTRIPGEWGLLLRIIHDNYFQCWCQPRDVWLGWQQQWEKGRITVIRAPVQSVAHCLGRYPSKSLLLFPGARLYDIRLILEKCRKMMKNTARLQKGPWPL